MTFSVALQQSDRHIHGRSETTHTHSHTHEQKKTVWQCPLSYCQHKSNKLPPGSHSFVVYLNNIPTNASSKRKLLGSLVFINIIQLNWSQVNTSRHTGIQGIQGYPSLKLFQMLCRFTVKGSYCIKSKITGYEASFYFLKIWVLQKIPKNKNRPTDTKDSNWMLLNNSVWHRTVLIFSKSAFLKLTRHAPHYLSEVDKVSWLTFSIIFIWNNCQPIHPFLRLLLLKAASWKHTHCSILMFLCFSHDAFASLHNCITTTILIHAEKLKLIFLCCAITWLNKNLSNIQKNTTATKEDTNHSTCN